ncbi:MAG: Addiction module toxin, RelE/StbE family [Parcubacteria group bacterium Gr01-1014_29]|nr:MAG: Addiction module toxin, RelE/StbE family [Parcubacteria group bacterium Gr01-1014_29]
MSWRLIVDKSVSKELKRVPRKIATRVFSVIEHLVEDPFFGDIEKMEGEDFVWRRRVGSYRIFYEVLQREKLIRITNVKRRTSKTY